MSSIYGYCNDCEYHTNIKNDHYCKICYKSYCEDCYFEQIYEDDMCNSCFDDMEISCKLNDELNYIKDSFNNIKNNELNYIKDSFNNIKNNECTETGEIKRKRIKDEIKNLNNTVEKLLLVMKFPN